MKREVWKLALLIVVPIGLMGGAPAQAAPRETKINRCPFTITAPGAYVLQKNLSCVGTAITVAANDVDLDLGGHTLAGNGTGDGIFVQGRSNVRIHDGAVQRFFNGIGLQSALNCQVTNVTANQNIFGIAARNSTTGLAVTGCTAYQNGDSGIMIESDSRANTLTNNTANQNWSGIRIFCGTFNNTVSGNTANGNRFAGIFIECDSFGNTVTGNTTNQNMDSGIRLYANGNTVAGNIANQNTNGGIDIFGNSHGNTVANNSLTGNGDGIRMLDNPFQNSVQSNTIVGSRFGIWLGGGANNNTIAGNTATLNIRGIQVDPGGSFNTIQSNTAQNSREWDLADDNFECDANTWSGNTFTTANQSCIQ